MAFGQRYSNRDRTLDAISGREENFDSAISLAPLRTPHLPFNPRSLDWTIFSAFQLIARAGAFRTG